MKTLLTASVELGLAGCACAVLGELSDVPAIHALTPIGYLLLSGGGLLFVVVLFVWLSFWWESIDSKEEPD
ncbi:hypothetical protein SAMN05216359_10140 [Roseateles sp. YR242]|uniref:hypothetical protein n=1 Tax=Roseateles sp. YR242 TaxID=1855305 RepID=UPI0008AE6331|nr:hypothetical protein [Roseateles sp. YR242]SEK21578.1 hypothetical protein SAMN05216359_10140 [Roseateles sp. YR242]